MKTIKTPRKKKVVVADKVSLITISLKLNGSEQVIHTDNVLHALRELAVNPLTIKTYALFKFSAGNLNFNKLVKIPQMKMIIANDLNRKMFAKVANLSLGIKVANYD